MKIQEAKEGLRVFDAQGTGTLHRNVGHENVSEWYVKWNNGDECAVLDLDYLYVHPDQTSGAMSYTEAGEPYLHRFSGTLSPQTTKPDIIHKSEVEKRVEEKGLQEDRQITQALNVITFLTEFVHGRVNGRLEYKNELALLNAADQFSNLTRQKYLFAKSEINESEGYVTESNASIEARNYHNQLIAAQSENTRLKNQLAEKDKEMEGLIEIHHLQDDDLKQEFDGMRKQIADLESSRDEYAIGVLNWSMHRDHNMNKDQRERLQKIVNSYKQSI
jgi:hypothetical protein